MGFLLPDLDELSIAVFTSKVTSDCIVDAYDHWWNENKTRFPDVDTLFLLQDNGPENSGRRTQFLARMVNFVEKHQVNVRLAYYPPYHSKYNPVERCWGVLERHWNGALLDTVDAVVGYAESMTWKQQHPVVRVVTQTYESGVPIQEGHEPHREQAFPIAAPFFMVHRHQLSGSYMIRLRASFRPAVGPPRSSQ